MTQCMAKISGVKGYKVKSDDLYFFDNNIWIFLFAPIAATKATKQKEYAALLQSIQAAKASIYINSLVLAEFANFCLRLSFNQWKEKNKKYGADYKRDYISAQDYKDAALDVKDSILLISKIANRKPDDFNAVNLNSILNNIQNIDFNDSYYAEYCNLNKIKIVTDDKDFMKIDYENLEVITLMN